MPLLHYKNKLTYRSTTRSLGAVTGVLLLVFVLGIIAPVDAFGQVELIVRLDDTGTDVERALSGSKSAQASQGELFDGVLSSRPVFARSTRKSRADDIAAYVVRVPDSTVLRRLQSRWEGLEGVRYVSDNPTFQIPDAPRVAKLSRIPENAFADSLDHLNVIRAREAQEITRGDPSVRIGIIDTGIDFEHPDLATQLYINDAEDLNGNGRFDESDLNGVDDDGNGFVDDVSGFDFVDRPGFDLTGEYENRDPDARPDTSGRITGHGTFVAGIATGGLANRERGVLGVAPDARFVSLRAFGADGRGQTDDIAAAIVYAADQELEIINLSFGRDRPAPLIEEAVRYAHSRGVTIIASAGNQSTDDPHYPSDYAEVISVMWLSEDGTGIPDVISQSQYGIGVDIGAPGSNVFTSFYPGPRDGREIEVDDLYGNVNGSSFATPQVAGAAALLLSQDPDLDPESIRSILVDTAEDLQEPGWNHVTAAGRIDALRAVQRAVPSVTEITTPAFNDGVRGDQLVAVKGSATNPNFASYSVFYASGTTDFDQRPDPWIPITSAPVERPAISDTLASWDVRSIPEGEYTLRLVMTKRDGSSIEDRRRVYVDRTPPDLSIRSIRAGIIDGTYGVLADVATDDVTQTSIRLNLNGRTYTEAGEYEVRRHALRVADPMGQGGTADVTITATNTAGFVSSTDVEIEIPSRDFDGTRYQRSRTSVPAGRVLPQPVDFDRDGLAEIVVNQRSRGSISDTLRLAEWGGSEFLPAFTFIASVIPRDVGDPDGDGRTDLLTQVASATLLLEQETPGSAFPTAEAFIDTTGFSESDSEDTLVGALLTDLDADGLGEIVGHNRRAWRVLEQQGDSYIEVTRLPNPTSAVSVDSAALANAFGPAIAADGDFDGDGRMDLLVGDRDGDLIVYENVQDDSMRVAWTDASALIDAGDRMATGDINGDGVLDFVTFRQTYPLTLDNGEVEPPLGVYEFWSTTGDDAYAKRGEIAIAGEVAPDGGIEAADFDRDGRAEVAISHPPELYIAEVGTDGTWNVVYYDNGENEAGKIVSASMGAGDFDGDGTAELLVSTSDSTMWRYAYDAQAAGNPAPRWTEARPLDASTISLAWRAPGADSVTVFDAPEGEALSRALVSVDSSATLSRATTRTIALQAWYTGDSSPLSDARTVRPHDPATLIEAEAVGPASARLLFTEPLHPSTQPIQFVYGDTEATGLTFGTEERSVVVRFEDAPTPTGGTLRWSNVVDASDLPVADTAVAIDFPKQSTSGFLIADWSILDQRTVALEFNRPVNPSSATTASLYSVTPTPGTVSTVRIDPDIPNRVIVEVAGIIVGATGQESLLKIGELRSADGRTLDEKSRAVRLSEPATSLDNAFIYPNPYRASAHGGSLTIGGLPSESSIRIFSSDGRLVNILPELRTLNGGRTWDLRDNRGQKVPSGIYIFRIESPADSPVVRRAAVIQ